MAMTIHLDIVSAENEIYSGKAEMIVAPAEVGEIGIYPRHTPLLTRLKAGEVRIIEKPGKEQSIYVSGGILEIQPHVVTILSDTAVRSQDLDEASAMEAKEKAEKMLSDRNSDMEIAQAKVELMQAVAQLRAIESFKKRR